jgi:hypothetical protein
MGVYGVASKLKLLETDGIDLHLYLEYQGHDFEVGLRLRGWYLLEIGQRRIIAVIFEEIGIGAKLA